MVVTRAVPPTHRSRQDDPRNGQSARRVRSHSVHLKEPSACTEGERQEFARLVRQGFATANEGLDSRLRDAKWLAFYSPPDDTLGAVAALKVPTEQYREDVFRKADARVSSADYELELGWVFVVPAHRGNRIAERLCQLLLERVPVSCVFATTRTDNISMMKILHALGFTRVGTPYPWRNEELALFLRS
jgi:GNAT superfamily N-acetyltransferase